MLTSASLSHKKQRGAGEGHNWREHLRSGAPQSLHKTRSPQTLCHAAAPFAHRPPKAKVGGKPPRAGHDDNNDERRRRL